MSQTLTAKQICEEALGAISAFPVTDSAADPDQLRRAMTWLDLIMGETAGVERVFSLIPATLSFPITNGTGTYDLNSTLGSDLPPDRIQAPVQAWLEDENGNRSPITIVTREKFEGVPNSDETGPPRWVYIDRLPLTPILRIFPTPATADTKTYTVKIDVQTYAPNVAPAGVTGTKPSGSVAHGFRQAWQRWLVLQLAHDLGSGPIHKLPQASLDNFAKKAAAALLKLLAYENREHDTEDPVGEPNGYM